MKCKKYKQEDLLLYCYNELKEEEKSRVEEHLKDCPYCEMFVSRQKALDKVLKMGEVPEVSPLVVDKVNRQIMEKLKEEEPITKSRGRFFLKVVDILYYPFSRPVYAFSSLLFVFVLGLVIGKIWMGSTILEDPGVLVSLIESRSEMSPKERDYLKKMVAGYFLGAKELEIEDVKGVGADKSDKGLVQIDFRINRKMNLTGGLDDPVILNVLKYSALYDRDPDKRARAVRMLHLSRRFEENKEVFLAVLLNDEAPEPRWQALEAISEFTGDEEVREVLKKVLLNDPDERMRMRSLDILAEVGGKNLRPVFALVAYRDSSEVLRERAREVLGKLYNAEEELR